MSLKLFEDENTFLKYQKLKRHLTILRISFAGKDTILQLYKTLTLFEELICRRNIQTQIPSQLKLQFIDTQTIVITYQ